VFYLLSALEEKAVYTELEKDLAHFTRALGHPARVAVLVAIAQRGYHVRNEIIEVPQLSQATVLQHLRELKRAGLLQDVFSVPRSITKLTLKIFENSMSDFIRS